MKIILIAYKIEAGKGSEDGTGYHLVKALLNEDVRITLITRSNNIAPLKIDPAFKEVELIAVDVPRWIGFFKKGARGIIPYYYLWQIAVGLKVRALQKLSDYDVIHQLNFHTTWAPHFLFSKKSKIIWGPITRHAEIPEIYWLGSRLTYLFKEKLKSTLKAIQHRCDPFLYWAIKRSDKIFYSAAEICYPYDRFKSKLSILPYAGSSFPILPYKSSKEKFSILFIGRFVNLKGIMVFLSVLDRFTRNLSVHSAKKVRVAIIGDGPLYTDVAAQTQLMTSATGVEIEMLPWQEQSDLSDHYATASLFFYPSFEGQGLVVAEALAHGCPILCFKDTGPHRVAGNSSMVIPITESLSDNINAFEDRLEMLFKEFTTNPTQYQKRVEKAFERAKELDWSRTAEKFIESYHA